MAEQETDGAYHELRKAKHLLHIKLTDEAYALSRRIHEAYNEEVRQCGPFPTPRRARLLNISLRTIERAQRRVGLLRLFGINEAAMQSLDTFTILNWRGKRLKIVDWKCHYPGLSGPTGRRIVSEPLFVFEDGPHDSMPFPLSPSAWFEMTYE